MIATYIQELLATNNRVIVPNYGAFLVRATSKSKDANTLEDKLKDIYFSPFLKFNDELLEKYIIQKENITKEQAADQIKAFIDDIKKELDQEKPYEIINFGKFIADKQGKVQFTPFAKVESEVKEEQKKEIKKEPKKTTSASKKAEAKPSIENVEVKKEEVRIEPKKEIQLEELKPEEKIIIPMPETHEKPKETPQKTAYSYKKEKKPVNKSLIWSIALGLPLAAIFVWAILNFNTIEKVFQKDKTKTEKQIQKEKTSTTIKGETKPTEQKTEQANAEAKQEQTAKSTSTQKSATPEKKYYIIAGSFKNEKYAESYLTKLKSEGYNAEKLTERNGMYAISYNSFTDKKKAIAEYKFLAQEKGLQAWILYY